jgi:hypothetical protein
MRLIFAFVMGCSATGDATPENIADSGLADSGVAETATTDSGTGFDVSAETAPTTYPVRKIPGLKSITYYERSGGTMPTAYTYTIDGPEMTKFIPVLSDSAYDIKGVDSEFYDVYYSNAAGEFELDGRYLTISGVFNYALPAGGGLNLAEIVLNYESGTKEFGNYVASFKTLGDNAAPGDVSKCIDSDLNTHTTMGNTVGSMERLRITLGFKSSSGPPK